MNPTRKITEGGVKGMVLLLALALASCAPASATHPSTESPQATKPQVLAAYGKLPLSFEANQGQTEPQVKFLSRGSGYTLFLTSTEAVLMLTKTDAHAKHRIPGEARLVEPEKGAGTVLRMKLLGANPAPAVAGVGELPGKSNYFVGNDPKKWRANVPTYAKIEYRDVYPGVNLVYYGNQRQLEHDFVVSPGADPKAITLAFEGMDGVAIDALGDLVLRADGGEVRLRKPVVYQEQNGQRAVIPTRYVLKAERQVAFEVAAYDATKPLIIDPVLAYSTYLGGRASAFGGNADDEGLGIAVDAAGNAYVTGRTLSTSFPTTPGAFQVTFGGGFFDAFVTKLNGDGSALVYSTYLGGSVDDRGNAIAVDAAGNAYVTGSTSSNNFPTTSGAVQPTCGISGGDAFVSKLNETGTTLVYSTCLGGSGGQFGNGIAVDVAGNAYVTGQTTSPNFPTTLGAFQPSPHGGIAHAFVTKVNPTGTGLVYSTYLGGSGIDLGNGIAVDVAGNAYVTGFAGSTDFPTTPGAFQTARASSSDAFVTKVNPTGTGLVYSTYLGGNADDEGFAIAVDVAGNAYVTGRTNSPNFPTTLGAFQTTFAGGGDAFVTKLNTLASGSASLVYSTYLGGSRADVGFGIAVDVQGNAYVTGSTNSRGFPTTPGAFQTDLAGVADADAFLTKLTPTGTGLVYSTYLGGSLAGSLGGGSIDQGFGIAVDVAGNAYVTGRTQSRNFPTTPGAFQTALAGGFDAFVAKFSFGNTPEGAPVTVPLGVPLGQVTVTFADVTAAGNTTLTTSSAGPSPPTPSGFKLGTPPTYYDLTTTASFSGDVTVCINYNTITFNNVASLKLFHFVDPNWVDATVSLDTATQIICGRVTSLSPFAIFELAIEPFAAFHARVEIEHERQEREFELKATFTLGAGSNGIHPDTEVVTLEVGTFSATIPAGSFRRHGHGTFKFEGLAGGARLEVRIQARGGNRFEFKAEGKGAQVGTANPVTVRLAVGDDAGSTLARVKADDDD